MAEEKCPKCGRDKFTMKHNLPEHIKGEEWKQVGVCICGNEWELGSGARSTWRG